MHRRAARLLTSRADAEDVTAAAFLEMWRHRERVRLVDGSVHPSKVPFRVSRPRHDVPVSASDGTTVIGKFEVD